MVKSSKSQRATRSKHKTKWLVFVDTNVLLDFYRLGGESAKRTLATLARYRDSLITTDQVWMEFLKNRQKVMTETIRKLTKPTNHSMPSFLHDFKVVKAFSKRQSDSINSHRKVIQTIEKILKDPARYDPVFQSLSRIFYRDSQLNLKRPNKQRYAIRHLARKRFSLGYPPRKDDTLRFGDSIFWEWIIECASRHNDKPNVVQRSP